MRRDPRPRMRGRADRCMHRSEAGGHAPPPGVAHARPRPGFRGRYDRALPDRLYFTDSDEANALIASDPMALLVGFVLDQQVAVQKAFMGPLVLKERLGSIDAETLAGAELEPVFRQKPAIHRF